MRRFNSYLCVLMLLLFLVHAIAGSYQLAGIIPGGDSLLTAVSWLLAAAAALHAAIGIILTAETLRRSLRSGVFYPKENLFFIIRRVSGFLMLILIALHVVVFEGTESMGNLRLNSFGNAELILSILLILTLIVHIICNLRPLCISLGFGRRGLRRDAAIVLAVVLIFAAAMFAYYYYRWNLGWR